LGGSGWWGRWMNVWEDRHLVAWNSSQKLGVGHLFLKILCAEHEKWKGFLDLRLYIGMKTDKYYR
jgi:hypothetical protein